MSCPGARKECQCLQLNPVWPVPPPPAPAFLASSVGKKVVMAITGLIMSLFVTVHMIGNLQAYMGAEPMNHYADFLQHMIHGEGIWVFRLVMLTTVGLHAWAALTLTLED